MSSQGRGHVQDHVRGNYLIKDGWYTRCSYNMSSKVNPSRLAVGAEIPVVILTPV